MKYRGVRYTIRMRIQREEWYVAIHPDGAELPGKVVAGSREDAELQVQSMIDAWLRKRGVQIPKRRQFRSVSVAIRNARAAQASHFGRVRLSTH